MISAASYPVRDGNTDAQSPLKSTPLRPSLVRKQDETETDLKEETPLSPSSKRAKVAFNEDVEVQVYDDRSRKADIVREETARALHRHAIGDSTGYDTIKSLYLRDGPHATPDDEPPTLDQLTFQTAGLLNSLTSLGRPCSDLIGAVIESFWYRRSEEYVSLFIKFIGNLGSVQGVWLSRILNELVSYFLRIPKPKANSDNLLSPSSDQIWRRVHNALRTLRSLVPSSPHVLAKILSKQYPQPTDPLKSHISYVQNLLTLASYIPELRPEILAVITNNVVKIDAEVQVDIRDLEDDIDESIVGELSRSRVEILGEESDEDDDSEDELDEPDQGKQIINKIQKLDLILDLLFEEYSRLFSDPKLAATAWEILASHFINIILPCYRSRHSQFLLFHFAQTPERIDLFVDILIKIILNQSRASLIRTSAAAYLSSFVARGLHVPDSTVANVFDVIGGQVNILRARYAGDCQGPDPQRYKIYYALVQCLLYIFCFRWKSLVVSLSTDIVATPSPPSMLWQCNNFEEDNQFPTFLSSVRDTISENIWSELNPLRVISPIITAEFARIGAELRLIYLYTKIESNRRVRLVNSSIGSDRRETALSNLHDDTHILEAYFPYDPYRLPRSKRWIDGDYREWSKAGGDDEDDESDNNEEENGSDADSEQTATEVGHEG